MSTSALEYQKNQAWVNDTSFSVWMYLLSQEISKEAELEPWLLEWRDHLVRQYDIGGGGILTAGLDRYISDEARRQTALRLAQQVMDRLDEYGGVIPKDELSAIGIGGTLWIADSPTSRFKQVGRTALKLLRGDLSSDPDALPIVHMKVEQQP